MTTADGDTLVTAARTPHAAAVLNVDDHVARLEADGYTVVPDVLSADARTCACDALVRLLESDPGVRARLDIGAAYLQVENLPNKGRPFETFFANDRVVPIVGALLGSDFIAHDIWAFGIPPGAIPDSLHSDEPLPSPAHPISLVTIYALNEFSAKTGATRIVPGTHRASTGPPPNLFDHDEAVAVEMEPGSCLVLRGSVWHGTGTNVSDGVRLTIAAKFSRPWLRPYTDFTRSLRRDVLARASDDVLRMYGFEARPQFTELWQWDARAGRPKDAFVDECRAAGMGKCCLGGSNHCP